LSAVAERTERPRGGARAQRDGNADLDGVPSIVERPHPPSTVYGGGGVFGISHGLVATA
jgi:hypothetical protein